MKRTVADAESERQQLEQKVEFAKEKVASASKQNVKRLTLVIMKYNGALENWQAFWNTEIQLRRRDGSMGSTAFLLHQKATSM